MAPKAIEFDQDSVLRAAVEVVRHNGLTGLSARSVAARLGSSVAPVYSAFGSMAALERRVLEEAGRLIDERTRHAFTDIPALNIAVGVASFARDEPRLFSALFHSKHPFQDIMASYYEAAFPRLKEDTTLSPVLSLLSDASLERLQNSMWLFTFGLATALVYGQRSNVDDAHLIRVLRDVGYIFIYAEATGIADEDSSESERAWRRLFKEKGLPWSAWPRSATVSRPSSTRISPERTSKRTKKSK